MSKSNWKLFYLILFMTLICCGGCVNDWVKEESGKDIAAFYIAKEHNRGLKDNKSQSVQKYDGLIQDTNITVFMPAFVSDRSALAAYFVSNAETVKVNGRPQTAGMTLNDFSANRVVIYTAIAEDGSSRDYTVRVVNPPDREISDFRLRKSVNDCLTEDVEGVIAPDKNEIHLYRGEMDANCQKLAFNFQLSWGAQLKNHSSTLQSGVTSVEFGESECLTHIFVAADAKEVEWKVCLKTINSEAQVKDFHLPYENGDYKQVFEGIVNYPDIKVYLNDKISLRSVWRFASDPVITVSDGASYEVEKVSEDQAESAALYRIKVTSSNGKIDKYYNVRFSYEKPAILSFKLQPRPSSGNNNNIETEIPGRIYEERDDEGNLSGVSSIYLKFPAGEKIKDSYIPSFSFSSYKIVSHGAGSTASNVINRQSPAVFSPYQRYRLLSEDSEDQDDIIYEVKADNEAPSLAGQNKLLIEAEESSRIYKNFYIKPERYHNCRNIPELNSVPNCENDEIIAHDNITGYNELECGLFYSRQDNIDTLEDIKANGILLGDYYAFYGEHDKIVDKTGEYLVPLGKCQFRVRRKKSGALYFNMIVRDRAGHETALADKATEVLESDHSAPQTGSLLAFPIDMKGKIVLQWPPAHGENPQNTTYIVYYSQHNNIDTVERAEANGTVVVDSKDLSSYELSIKDYPCMEPGCYFNVVVEDISTNKAAYKSVKYIYESFEGLLEKTLKLSVSDLTRDSSGDSSGDKGGYFTRLDVERAVSKHPNNTWDVLAFPVSVRKFALGVSRDSYKNGEHTFELLNVFPNGDVTIDNRYGSFKQNLSPMPPDLIDSGFDKVRLGIFQLRLPGRDKTVESAALMIGDKFNRYAKLRLVAVGPGAECEAKECVYDSVEMLKKGLTEPVRSNYHYLNNGQLAALPNGSILTSRAIQKEENNRSLRRHALEIYDPFKQEWREIALDKFKEVKNYSLNAPFDPIDDSEDKVPVYGTEIHPIPPVMKTFYKVGSDGVKHSGFVVIHAQGSFTFDLKWNDGKYSFSPRHRHNLTMKIFSDNGALIKEEKLETGVIANQYPSVTSLNNGDLMVIYPVSKFVDDDGGWFNLETEIKASVYMPDKASFAVKGKSLKTIKKKFVKHETEGERIYSIMNPVTKGNFADLVPGAVSSITRGDKVVIAYRDPDDENKGKFVVCDNKAEPISQEIAFSSCPLANDIYYIRDPLYSFETFAKSFNVEEDMIDEYRELAGKRTDFTRIVLGAFKDDKVLISFIPADCSGDATGDKIGIAIIE